jgi:hypothetical protein
MLVEAYPCSVNSWRAAPQHRPPGRGGLLGPHGGAVPAARRGLEEQCTRAFDERVHPAVDAAFGGRRPPVEPIVHRLDVVDVRGAAAAGARA